MSRRGCGRTGAWPLCAAEGSGFQLGDLLIQPHLQTVHLRIQSVLRHQLSMAALLEEPAFVEHEDSVRPAYEGEAMRGDERRTALHQPHQRLRDDRLRFGFD